MDWKDAVTRAKDLVRSGDGDVLVVLPTGTDIPGAQHDDNVTAIAAVDLVDFVEAGEREDYELRRAEQFYSGN